MTPPRPAESVAEYPRPPRVEAVPWRVVVTFDGVDVADSTATVRICETYHPPVYYIPPADVRTHLLRPAGGGSWCEWKGVAAYWDVVVGDRVAARAAWSYPEPSGRYEVLRDHLAFYAGRVDACRVDDDAVVPQPGDFYGGWITPEITGPIKGAPGTRGW